MAERQFYLTDNWTLNDHLEFSDFQPALQRILLEAGTPLTVGIYGPWGSGKTSLLRMLYQAIEDRGLPYVRPLWFTAWKYDQQESLWRTFMLRVIDTLYPREEEPRDQPRYRRERLLKPADATQQKQVQLLDQLEASVYQPVDWQEMGRLMVDWLQVGKSGLGVATKVAKLFIPGVDLLDQLLSAGKLSDSDQALLTRQIHTAHRRQLVEREQFESSFAEAINLILGVEGYKGRLIVFVDDLDRCLPEKAVQVLEAIKLFLSVPGAVFVLGMDREVIQRGIEAHYRAYFQPVDGETISRAELPIRGDSYLQKLVQIPFHLPPLSIDQTETFLEKLENEGGLRLSGLTRRVLAQGLYPNPRQVKRALNIFHLLREIANHRQAGRDDRGHPRLAADAVADALLAKTVVIQTQYPELYQDWRRYPTLVRTLEEEVMRQPLSESERLLGRVQRRVAPEGGESTGDGGETRSGGLIEKYLRNREQYALLERMLRFPDEALPNGERGRFEGLTAEQMAVYVHLAGSVAPEAPALTVGVDLGDLLSNDWAKIQDAIERLPAEVKQKPEALRRQLEQVLAGHEAAPAQRASAGYALGLLGDTRPGVTAREPEMVPIRTGLRFLMGATEVTEVEIAQPYAIARYPVTNAQFRFFVEDGGYTAAKWLQQCWTEEGRRYLEAGKWTGPRYWDDPQWALPNLPVVGVSWYEALAYANWLQAKTDKPYRLPTEAEWERAARFTDGREYTWGSGWRDGAINSEEAGLGRTTAVGSFPGGVSVEGIHDLSGNVWEWCQTRWRDEKGEEYPQPYHPDDGREELSGDIVRVLRGGSWYSDAQAARCGARGRYDPALRRDYDWGVRLVLSPLPSLASGPSDL